MGSSILNYVTLQSAELKDSTPAYDSRRYRTDSIPCYAVSEWLDPIGNLLALSTSLLVHVYPG